MNRFYVVTPNGQRYGPANVQLLNSWIAEGRVLPDTVVENAVTGERLLVSQIPGVSFGQHPQAPAQPQVPVHPYVAPTPVLPQHDPYAQWTTQPPQRRESPSMTVAAYALLAVSTFMCASPAGWLMASGALVFALVGKARGERGAGCAIAMALFTLVCVVLAGQAARYLTSG